MNALYSRFQYCNCAEASNMDSQPPSLPDRVKAIEQLTQIFRIDGAFFLVATALALLFLLAVAGRLLIRVQGSMPEWTCLFGSSGLITVTIKQHCSVSLEPHLMGNCHSYSGWTER